MYIALEGSRGKREDNGCVCVFSEYSRLIKVPIVHVNGKLVWVCESPLLQFVVKEQCWLK